MNSYQFHSNHFPAMVADISLESLDSPTNDDNFRYQQTNQPTNMGGGDINSNVQGTESTRSFFRPKLPELYNDRAPTDKLLNEMNEKLSPKSRMQNLNDWDLVESGISFMSSSTSFGRSESMNRMMQSDYSDKEPNKQYNDNEVCSLRTTNCLPDAIPTTSRDRRHSGSFERAIQESIHIEQPRVNDIEQGLPSNDLYMPKPDIVSSHEIAHSFKHPASITDSTDSISSDYRPIVNIKTLGDENDGSYEICIQNIFTKNVIPVSKTEEQIKGHLQENGESATTVPPYSKSFHGGLRYCDDNEIPQAVTRMDTSRKIPKFDTTAISSSSTHGKSSFFRSKYKTDNRSTQPDEASRCHYDEEPPHTDYARLMSSSTNIKYEPLNLPYHTIRSVKTSPILSENQREEGFVPKTENAVPSGPKEESFSTLGTKRRRPRLLPKIPTDQQPKYREQAILTFEQPHSIRPQEICLPANIKSPETIFPPKPPQNSIEPSAHAQGDENNATGSGGKRSRFWRPKSWAGSLSWRDELEESRDGDSMTRSDYFGRAEGDKRELPNTLSLASELNEAEQALESTEDSKLPSPICSPRDPLTRAHTHPNIALEELGSPEVIEPSSLMNSVIGHLTPEEDPKPVPNEVPTPDQVRILNEVNTLKSEASISHKECSESELWLRGLLSASFCNKCRSTSPFNIMKKSLDEANLTQSLETKKSPTDLYIDDIPKSKESKTRQLILEFKREERPRGRYELDKNALQLHWLQTPMDERVDPFPIPVQEESPVVTEPSIGEDVEIDIDDFDVTHRGCHKFIPRHPGELFIEIGDPLYVEEEEDDLWCKGLNLRTKKKGIFPSVCATDLTFQDGMETIRPMKYYLRFLGSIEVGANHKSNRVIHQAIDKVVMTRKLRAPDELPPLRCLEITSQGIRLSNKVKAASLWSKASPRRIPQETDSGCSSQSDEPMERSTTELPNLPEHLFQLKNVSFVGCHPKNDKYMAFITKHPLEVRFACHILLGENSVQNVVDSIGRAFRTYTHQYLAASHPTEDIYIE